MILNALRQEHSKKQCWLYAAVFFWFLWLYAATAQRGVGWQDSGEFQYRIGVGDYHWYSGIARAHPLYILMARAFTGLFPKALFFYAANLFSGVGMACSVALLAACVRHLTSSIRAAVLAAVVLGTAHMAWWMSTVAEVYTWSLACLMAELYGVIRWQEKRNDGWLLFVSGMNGVHFGIHNFALLGLPVYMGLLLAEVMRTRKVRLLAGAVFMWLLGCSLIGAQVFQAWQESGSFSATLKSVLFGTGYEKQVLGTGGFPLKQWLMNLVLAGLSILNPCWLLAFSGLRRLYQKKRSLFFVWGTLLLLYGFFWVRYFVPDQATFVLPVLGLIALMVGMGYGRLETKNWKLETGHWMLWAGLLVIGAAVAAGGPRMLCEIADRNGEGDVRGRSLPFRNDLRYWLVPWKQNERSAEKFVDAVRNQLKNGDVLVADSTSASPLMAVRARETIGAEWRLITPWTEKSAGDWDEALQEGRVYVVSPVRGYVPIELLSEKFTFQREGVLWRVLKRR